MKKLVVVIAIAAAGAWFAGINQAPLVVRGNAVAASTVLSSASTDFFPQRNFLEFSSVSLRKSFCVCAKVIRLCVKNLPNSAVLFVFA